MAYPLLAVRVDSERAVRYLSQVRDTAERWGRSRTVVYSPLVYAYGIETGYHRRGQLARRAGGAFMVRDAVAETKPRTRELIRDSFGRGPQAVPLAEANIGRMVVAAIRRRTPVRSGRLRGSFGFRRA
jgi:hypothetical protein